MGWLGRARRFGEPESSQRLFSRNGGRDWAGACPREVISPKSVPNCSILCHFIAGAPAVWAVGSDEWSGFRVERAGNATKMAQLAGGASGGVGGHRTAVWVCHGEESSTDVRRNQWGWRNPGFGVGAGGKQTGAASLTVPVGEPREQEVGKRKQGHADEPGPPSATKGYRE